MPQAPGTLVREVELPRRASLAGPIFALVAAVMVTLMTALAITARPERRATRPLHIDHRHHRAAPGAAPGAAPAAAPAVAPRPTYDVCGQTVYRASPDGRAEQFEDCAAIAR